MAIPPDDAGFLMQPAPPLSPRQRYGYLPANLMIVLEVAGEDAMLRLVAARGGTRLHLGRPPRDDSPLTLAVGLDAAIAIQQRFAADSIPHIDIPIMSTSLVRHRVQRILELRAAGVKVADVAQQLGMTERGVYIACARVRDETELSSRQLSLPI